MVYKEEDNMAQLRVDINTPRLGSVQCFPSICEDLGCILGYRKKGGVGNVYKAKL